MSNKPIRILHVIGRMDFGGAETMIMNLYRHIDRSKVQFDFVENWPERAAFDDEIESLGGRIFRCPQYNVYNHFSYSKWWDKFMKEHYSEFRAVHAHVGRCAFVNLKYAKKYGVFGIAHSHNTSKNKISDWILELYSLPLRMYSNFYFACSYDAGLSRYGKKICCNQNLFRVLNNAIDTVNFRYNLKLAKEVRKKYGIDDKIVIGHVGRFFEQKNHTFLIDIFYEIYKKNKNTFLFLVGDGPLRIDIEKKIESLKLNENVMFLGNQSDVSAMYQAMDVFVFPSLFEGLGIVAVEAQNAGLKCIISNKVSKECIVTENQVSICDLKDDATVWADVILNQIDYERCDSSNQVKEHGYDINDTVNWLENFYMEETC